MKKIIRKKEITQVKSQPFEPATIGEPSTADEYFRRGLAFYARKQLSAAEDDLKEAIARQSDLLDASYVMGMVLKSQGKKAEAILAFQHVLGLIGDQLNKHTARFDMLRRLALGHINMINQGDWNLEKEIWKRIA